MCSAAGSSDLPKFVLVALGAYSGHTSELTSVWMPFNALSDLTEKHQQICCGWKGFQHITMWKQTVGFVEKCVKALYTLAWHYLIYPNLYRICFFPWLHKIFRSLKCIEIMSWCSVGMTYSTYHLNSLRCTNREFHSNYAHNQNVFWHRYVSLWELWSVSFRLN